MEIFLILSAIFLTVLFIFLFWEKIKQWLKNTYAYLFLDDTKYYWTAIHAPVYVNNGRYPNHIITELRGYWADGVYVEINPNLPFKKDMIVKFEGCKVFVTIVNETTREIFYENFIINQGKFW